MDLSNVDYRGLRQMLESVQINRIFKDLDRVLLEQINANDKRQQLSECTRFVEQSADALVKLVAPVLRDKCSATEISDVEHCLRTLQNDCFALSKHIDEQREADMKLGARENSLVKRLGQLKPIIHELAASAGLDKYTLTHYSTGSGTHSGESEASVDDLETLSPQLKSYYERIAKENALQERIDGILIEQDKASNSKHTLEEQDEPVLRDMVQSRSDLSALLNQLRQELADSRKESHDIRMSCNQLGIDVQETRWRRIGSLSPCPYVKNDQASSRLRGWLEDIHGPDGEIKEKCLADSKVLSIADQDFDTPARLCQSAGLCRSNDAKKERIFLKSKHGEDDPSHTKGSRKESPHIVRTSNSLDAPKASLVSGSSTSQLNGPERSRPHSRLASRRDGARNLPDPQPSNLRVSHPKIVPIGPTSQNIYHSTKLPRHHEYRKRPDIFYSFGTVFKVLKGFEQGGPKSTSHSAVTDEIVGTSQNGAPAVQQALWYLVIDRTDKQCRCLRIITNDGRGVSDLPPGEFKNDYSIVYTGKSAPEPSPEELDPANDPSSMRQPIRIRPHQYWLKFKPLQRLHWTEVVEIALNVKSALFGRVHPDSKDMMKHYLEDELKILPPNTAVPKLLSRKETDNAVALPETPLQAKAPTAKCPSSHTDSFTSTPVGREMPRSDMNPLSKGTQFQQKNRFEKGNVIDLVIDRGYFTQERRCRRLKINDVRHFDGKWQYRLQSTLHNGLYSSGLWVDESPWLVPAK